jgi:hypothetical protein
LVPGEDGFPDTAQAGFHILDGEEGGLSGQGCRKSKD